MRGIYFHNVKQRLGLQVKFLIWLGILCFLFPRLVMTEGIKVPNVNLKQADPTAKKETKETKETKDARPTGLETRDHQDLGYTIYLYTAADVNVLTEADLSTKIEQKISENSLKTGYSDSKKGYLSVELTLVEEAFNLSLKFKRLASYTLQNMRYESEMVAWELSGTGIYDGDKQYILKNLDLLLDKFITQYSQANQETANENK